MNLVGSKGARVTDRVYANSAGDVMSIPGPDAFRIDAMFCSYAEPGNLVKVRFRSG
jgi:hypothetical protein